MTLLKSLLTRRAAAALLAASAAFAVVAPGAAFAQDATGAPYLILELPAGEVEIELLPDVAPAHVARIVELTDEGFYDGVVFHRVIDGFMAQTGDPTGTGMGGSELPDLAAEFSNETFARGVLGMARAQSPDSANSQFFITFADAPHLNGQYTVFGRVVSGMEAVDALTRGTGPNGMVETPDAIVDATIEYR